MLGLGFVLSFGYWTTNFAEVQRALSAKSLSAAQRTPLIGAFPKIFIPAITVIPGLVALVTIPGLGSDKPNMEYNNAIPLLINEYLPNGMLGLALAGLMAAFMAGVAANVSAFNTVVTYDLWEPYVKPGQSDGYYLRFGRIATVSRHPDRHRHGADRLGLQEHHGLHPAAVLVLQRAAVRDVHHRHVLEADDAAAGFWGLVAGTVGAAFAHYGNKWGWFDLGSAQAAAFWGADGVRGRRDRLRGRDVRDQAEADRGAAGPRVRHGQRAEEHDASEDALVQIAEAAGLQRARPDRHPQPLLHLGATDHEPSDPHIAQSEEAEADEDRAARAANLFDVRRIIGALFAVYGVILTIVGIGDSDAEIDKAAGININLWTGLAMLVVGRRSSSAGRCCGRSARSCRTHSRRAAGPGATARAPGGSRAPGREQREH